MIMPAPSGSKEDRASNFSSRLVLANQLEELSRLATWIETIASYLLLTDRAKFRLEIVLTEAITNVIQYGFEEDGEIGVALERAGDDLLVEVRDSGRPFNPLNQPEVVFPRTLDDASQGGLGIHLIRSYSDECIYRCEAGENVLSIIIRDTQEPGED